MPDDDKSYRIERKKIDHDEIMLPQSSNVTPEMVQQMQRRVNPDVVHTDAPVKPIEGVSVKGNMPPALSQMLQQRLQETDDNDSGNTAPQQTAMPNNLNPFQQAQFNQMMNKGGGYKNQNANPFPSPFVPQLQTNDPALNELVAGLTTQNYEVVTLPSLGKFYASEDEPTGGQIEMRPMTGKEESILSSGRHMRGRGMEMIFHNCFKQQHIKPERLLSVDRTFLLIYLRAISYGNMYEVNLRCPACSFTFDHEIDLNLQVDYCPDEFDTSKLIVQLPVSKYSVKYRLMTGQDENNISDYRNRKAKTNNTNTLDDTFLYKASILIDWIGNNTTKVSNQAGIQALMERLPVADVNHIRNLVNDPPFGVQTKLDITCPACFEQFEIEMPYEENFFYPKVKIEM